MKTVYILGAGFSCDAGLPLSYDFLDRMENVRPLYQLGKTPPSLNVPMDELFLFRSQRDKLFDKSLINNVEFWLSLVSARSLGNVATRGFNKYKMQIAIAQTIAYYVDIATQSVKTSYVISFVKNVVKYGDQLITLNYDDLIERACDQVVKPYKYGFVGQVIGGAFKVDMSNYNEQMLDVNENISSIPIYKLHGSYNWMTKQEDVQVISDMQRFFANQEFWTTNEWTRYGFVIEPPTIDKIYSGHILTRVWNRTFESLVSASHIVVIGYSFPENDGYVKYLLMASLADNNFLKDVTIVDPYCDDAYAARIKWLLDLLDAKKVSVRFCQKTAIQWVQEQT
ncbi:SIR2 family protein [Acidithiobacillus sp.]|uniref:SIR2 family protein n=1 Tax=Acidithiobacillus sp. TaxID=1872118 RepID=UPI00260ABCFB|nr:SIR2 family protein [Acidithiobacillus sp.]MDD5279041.1 SIR2 family protein [Acidithiobacillus sp.]